jgi:hypothetical protein
MNCLQVENLFVESSVLDLDEKTKIELSVHLSTCTKCAGVYQAISLARNYLDKSTAITPSKELEKQTLELCHKEIAVQGVTFEESFVKFHLNIPKRIWLTLALVLSLSVFWVFSVFLTNNPPEILSIQNTGVLVLMVQNIIMLILSPLLFKKYYSRSDSVNNNQPLSVVVKNKTLSALLTF